MTQLRLNVEVFSDTNKLGPVKGYLEFVPRPLPNASESLLLPSPFRAEVGALVEITPTTDEWCWFVTENTHPPGIMRFITIPDTTEVVLYSTRHDVDPDTLAHTQETHRLWSVVSEGIDKARSDAQSAVNDATSALLAAQEAADSGIVLRIDSSRGTAFKNNTVSTTLSVSVFKGGNQITNYEDLVEAFGVSAYLEWWWRRLDDTDFGVISSSDDRLSQAGFKLTVSPNDVDEQTVFQCILHT